MSPAIDVRDLHFAYAPDLPALRGVSFSIAPGERVALIGPNGAGKSTLLLHLNGLLPEHGRGSDRITIDALPVRPNYFPEIRRRVGLLFQDPNDQLFCPTVDADVAFGPEQLKLNESEIRRRVEAALAHVGLAGLGDRPCHQLSGGEKRRACLAGLLACEPSILVLDEPTSGLDPRGRRETIALLRRTPVTQLIATHDLDLVRQLCPRVILLQSGRLVADGPASMILEDAALLDEAGL
jgi:cobalt/nickel transport system ATP-binding protein